jgi:spore coat protein CotH
VKKYPEAGLYDPKVIRTFFLEFPKQDWEAELGDFYGTDVELPAKLTVDGKVYPDVGVHFRGASSYFTVGSGKKRSLNISTDFGKEGQNIGGYHTLNLLNAHTDPTFLRTILYYQVAGSLFPSPKANFVRLVINGESWGLYINSQQFNKDFLRDTFQTTEGSRWKVPGSPRARGGLNYLGEDPEPYKKIYEIKSKDDPKSWDALINLCKILNQTPADQLEKKLSTVLDLDGVLKWLALENALINSDGYWIRTSDYNLYLDPKGKFHIVPHDANETFRAPGGPRGGDRAENPGVRLDPLAGADDPEKPLLNKLLEVPALKSRYLGYVKSIAEEWLDWKKLEPIIRDYQALIETDIKSDTRKLYSYEAFLKGVAAQNSPDDPTSLKTFAQDRRKYLLEHPLIVPAKVSK